MPADRRPSPIAGYGLFALSDHQTGAPIMDADDVAKLNHSCDPNLGFDTSEVVARRDIAPGDELTIDYAMFTTDPAFVLWCHCETYRCRQVIEGTDWQIPQLQQRYAGHWAPPVQQLIDDATR